MHVQGSTSSSSSSSSSSNSCSSRSSSSSSCNNNTTTAVAAATTTNTNTAAAAIWSRHGLVGIVTCNGLDGPCFNCRRKDFSLHENVQVGSGAHEASRSMGTRIFFPGGKAAGA